MALAARVLSTICELKIADVQLYRILAYKLEVSDCLLGTLMDFCLNHFLKQLNRMDGAVDALIRARQLRGDEPNSVINNNNNNNNNNTLIANFLK
jgi:hypothetical protein